jgi:hypothetical protein
VISNFSTIPPPELFGVIIKPLEFTVLVEKLIPAWDALLPEFVKNGIVQVEFKTQVCPLTVV